jgi:hypothetical protein
MRIGLSVPTLLLVACSGSHVPGGHADGGAADADRTDAGSLDGGGGGGCTGTPPACSDLVPAPPAPGEGCCGDRRRPMECVGGVFRCPAGFTQDCRDFWVGGMCASLRPAVCDVPSSCVLLPESCCGRCGAATPDDMIAVHVDRVMENRSMACADPVACPECFAETDPYLLATCRAGACVALNLHVEDLTLCNTATDCVLGPRTCCDCGVLGVDQAIAFNPARGSLGALTCDPDADCPPCVPSFDGIEAVCDAGRCVVRARDPSRRRARTAREVH